MSYKDDEITTQVQQPRKGVSFASFIGVVVIVVLLAGALVASVVSLKGSISELGGALEESKKANSTLEVALADAVNAVNEQMLALDKRDKELAQEIRKVQQAVTDNQAALAEYKTSQEARVSELLRSLEEIHLALRTTGKEIDSKIAAAREELGTQNMEIGGRVDELKKDKEYLVTELAKKAEKAYVTFIEKKLKKEIGAVSGKIDGVKEELEGKIDETKGKVDRLGSDMNKAIKESVDQRVKLDFKPSNPGQGADGGDDAGEEARPDAPRRPLEPADDDDDDDDYGDSI